MALGIIFGMYPAIKASGLQPVVACGLIKAQGRKEIYETESICSRTAGRRHDGKPDPSRFGGGSSSFSDVTDSATALNADVLRLMGVVSGTGGNQFNPGQVLTRAQFCTMVVNFMGKGDDVVSTPPAPFSATWTPPTGPEVM